MMHLLLISPGNSIHTKRFIENLLNLGLKITLLDSVDNIMESSANYHFIRYPVSRHFYTVKKFLGEKNEKNFHSWRQSRKIKKICRQIKPDVIHLHGINRRALEIALTGFHPVVFTAWGSDINDLAEKDSDFFTKDAVKRALLKADLVTGDTPQLLERAEHLAGRKLKKELFFFGIDLSKFKPGYRGEADELRKRLKIPENAKILLSVRSMRRKMGHHLILEAFSIACKNSDNLYLIFKKFLPDENIYIEELKVLAEKMGLSKKVIWINETAYGDMPAEYALADIVINYPEQDGLPVSLFESAACKRPVVTAGLTAYRDIVSEKFFWIAAPGNTQSLAEALRACLAAPSDVRLEKVDNAFRYVSRYADQSVCFKKMTGLYEELIRKV